jgi:hypothetical protein
MQTSDRKWKRKIGIQFLGINVFIICMLTKDRKYTKPWKILLRISILVVLWGTGRGLVITISFRFSLVCAISKSVISGGYI